MNTTPRARLFLVENEALIALELADRLTGLGYEIVGHALRGEAALVEIASTRPDLVLLDVNLGAGIDGIEVANRLRASSDVPILFLTAYADEAFTQRAACTGSSAYLVKPFRPEALRANVEMVLHTHHVERDLREANAALASRATALEEAAESRRRSDARFHELFELAPDALVVAGLDGRIRLANRQAEVLFGYDHHELVGLSIDMLVPDELRAAHAELRGRFTREGTPRLMGSRRSRLLARRKDGSHFPAEVSLGPLRSDDGAAVVAAVRDVSERVEADERRAALEAQLRESQKMEAIGTLAGGIAHDFNNLLAVILANVELATADVGEGHIARSSLDDIGVASRRAVALVRQILAFSRKQPSKRAAVEIGPIVAEVLRLLRAALPAGIELAANIEANLPCVLGDATQIHQVLMNLGTNAWHAIESGRGHVVIRAEERRISEPIGDAPAGRYVRLTVSDNGKGMDAITEARVFEPFFTTKESGRGTGLGLAVVHGIVSGHGGFLRVESELGAGTSFHVHLPVTERRDVEVAAVAEPSRRGDRQRVLLVDDEPALAHSMARLLERLGYDVTRMTRAREALDAIRNAASFDLVLTDLNMPEMTGQELAERLAALRPGLPVVLASGQSDELERLAGRWPTLQKPYAMGALSELLARLIGDGGRRR